MISIFRRRSRTNSAKVIGQPNSPPRLVISRVVSAGASNCANRDTASAFIRPQKRMRDGDRRAWVAMGLVRHPSQSKRLELGSDDVPKETTFAEHAPASAANPMKRVRNILGLRAPFGDVESPWIYDIHRGKSPQVRVASSAHTLGMNVASGVEAQLPSGLRHVVSLIASLAPATDAVVLSCRQRRRSGAPLFGTSISVAVEGATNT